MRNLIGICDQIFSILTRTMARSCEDLVSSPERILENRLRKVTFKEDQHRSCAETVLIKIVGAQNHRFLRVSMFEKKIVDMLVD